jgi:poly(hydroxyalkanoate) depolymerase family esterase
MDRNCSILHLVFFQGREDAAKDSGARCSDLGGVRLCDRRYAGCGCEPHRGDGSDLLLVQCSAGSGVISIGVGHQLSRWAYQISRRMDLKWITRIFGGRKLVRPRDLGRGKWVSGSASSASDSRKYRLWVPAAHHARVPSPLVMMLHGCTQKPEDLAEISGMNAVAGRNNFLVVYPQQTIWANLLRCWNWFDPKHQTRGIGEPCVLAAVVDNVRSYYSIDPDRVYVAGISAGAAMAVVLGATYPDLFRAIGVIAGLEFRAATSLSTGLSAMKNGGPDPNRQGLAAFRAMTDGLSEKPARRMPVIVFQGTADPYLNPLNADQVINQWLRTNACLEKNEETDGTLDGAGELTNSSVAAGYSFQKYMYRDGAGRPLMEKWMVEGLGHAWPGSPFAGAFADPKGPNASEEMWRFFQDTTMEAYPATWRTLWNYPINLLRRAGQYLRVLLRLQRA